MTNVQWKLLFGVVSVVCAFLLVQTDIPLDPIVKVVIGAVNVALAVLNPNRASGGT